MKKVTRGPFVGLTDDDYSLLADIMMEVVDETFQNINNQHT